MEFIEVFSIVLLKIFPWVSVVLSVFGVITNVINVLVFYRQGILSDSCTPCLVGLAMSDFCVCLISIPLNMILALDYLYPGRMRVILNNSLILKDVNRMFYQTSCGLTLYLSIERTVSVIFPFKVKTLFTPKRSAIIVACITGVNIALQVPFLLELNNVAFHDWFSAWTLFNIVVLRLVYIVGVVVFNISITVKVVVSKRFRKQLSAKAVTPQSNNETRPDGSNRDKKEMKLVKMMIICDNPSQIKPHAPKRPGYATGGLAQSTLWSEPQQIHIATGSSDQMIIVWNTLNDTKDTRVLYGTSKNMTHVTQGSRSKFVDGGPENRTQFVHQVTLTNLTGDTVYYYMAGSEKLGYSDIHSFRTWPVGEQWSPRLAVYGDMGNENAKSLPRLQVDAARGMYDAILHVGDFAYNMFENNGRTGDEFMRQIEPLASTVPYMTCPGNHENRYNFSNYKNRFVMPGDTTQRMYYSFKMGPVRFISTATEPIFYRSSYGLMPAIEHLKWLDTELKDANKPENRAKQPWVITFGHRPMYCSNKDGDDCTKNNSIIRTGIPDLHIPGWEDMFYENGVDVAIWAHEHSYERLWPVYNQTVKNGTKEAPYTNPGAPVHVITGSAGCREDITPFTPSTAPWSAFRAADYGYTRMKVYNSTHLYMEQVSDDKDGAILDKFTLIKDHHGSYKSVRPTNIKPKERRAKKWTKLNPSIEI